MRERYPPTPPFHCGENEIQVSLISSTSVGATPTPATNFGEVFRLPVCKTGVANNCRKGRLEHYQHLPPAFARYPMAGEGSRAEACNV